MNGYPSYPPGHYGTANGGNMDMTGIQGEVIPYDFGGGQSLDDIVNQNAKELRRRSMPVHYSNNVSMDGQDHRRLSMMDFKGMQGGVLDNYNFESPTTSNMDGIVRNGMPYPQQSNNAQTRRPSGGDLALNTQFSHQQGWITTMAPPASPYTSPLHTAGPMDSELHSRYGPGPGLAIPLENDPMMNNDINLYSQPQFASPMVTSPVSPDFGPTPRGLPRENSNSTIQTNDHFGPESGNGTPDVQSSMPSRPGSQEQGFRSNSQPESDPSSARNSANQIPTVSSFRPEPSRHLEKSLPPNNGLKFPWRAPTDGFPSTMGGRPHVEHAQYKNAYSSTGFNMLEVLTRVATRPNPEINIGNVDFSCAFVVCDAQKDDVPIVFCSDNFERLTGYTKHMILGRNCRFLQSPDGYVEAGIKRKYVDDDSVLYLKNMINMRKEAQISLINYRRGGQPFMNLLTMIPITMAESDEIKYYVGFQVDLVEQPASMTNKNPDGSYTVNYQRGGRLPDYVFTDHNSASLDTTQTVTRDEVSNALSTFSTSGDSEFTRRIWDKVLLENTDDVVYVLSLKGLFLYLSPSCQKVLEYDPTELNGSALSSVCHPSDIVPVTRELKDTSSGASVNVVFRILRKRNGYMWFEGHGSLHTEQGKGRKCIILVGRERPVYTLTKSDIRSSGGIGDNELWTKMSTSGMFLFVSSNVRQLLDRQPEDLVGTSIQALMRQDSKAEFGRILELTRTGRKGEVKHEMMNKRGQVLQAFTTLYPGDAIEGQKPTFLVAQTRLLKYSRSGNSTQSTPRPSLYPRERNSGEGSVSNASGDASSAIGSGQMVATGSSTPQTGVSGSQFVTTDASAATFGGEKGLQLGHQDYSLASEENVFDELKTTRSTSWQFELRQMEKRNRLLAEEVQSLLAAKKKRKRRKGAGQLQKDCANCHTRVTPEWRRGPSGNRDLCNSCGLRWAKQNGRVSPRTSSQHSQKSDSASKAAGAPRLSKPLLPNLPAQSAASDPSTKPTATTLAQQASAESHAAKVARMEIGASDGFSGGVPAKIDEGHEPD
ncbi:blue light regulator 1 [Lophium mytilinum]|uniref:Blue light regulator 1 n=1 Tax=Lophium mytilinum TaxID=390894 RepID=A0A6A6R6V3_9PEZI|nr:blue light regulator 1 [Lophium mytilinum]